MGQYLEQIDAVPRNKQWPLLRSWIFSKDPLPLFDELRQERPVLDLPELVLVSRFSDCNAILRKHQSFGVDLYQPKQGSYFMAQDDTAVHWREKSVMKAVLDLENVPAMRNWAAREVNDRLVAAEVDFDLINLLTRGIPLAMVSRFFGFDGADMEDMKRWSYWNQQDAFWNQPFDSAFVSDPAQIVDQREKANIELAIFLGKKAAKQAIAVKLGLDDNNMIARLLKLSFGDATKFSFRDVIFNAGGLLIGAVETISHCAVNALAFILNKPEVFASALGAAKLDDRTTFDSHVFEALRFKPAFPYFFRTCNEPTTLSLDRPDAVTIQAGRTVLALTHSAMFDNTVFPDAKAYLPSRNLEDCFTFGQGIHGCLGRHISAAILPEIVRQFVLQRETFVEVTPCDFQGGSVPEAWAWRRR